MRLMLDPRVARLVRRLPRRLPYSAIEILLLALIAVQLARIIWTIASPMGPIGEWRRASAAPAADPALLGRFDPFFRLPAASSAVVTSLALKLFGTRIDNARGGGSAIIATPDGIQSSYAVGDEIVPGVRLKSVSFDGVTIDRGGRAEQLFLDQTVAAPVAEAPPVAQQTAPSPPAPARGTAPTAADLAPNLPPPPPGGLK